MEVCFCRGGGGLKRRGVLFWDHRSVLFIRGGGGIYVSLLYL